MEKNSEMYHFLQNFAFNKKVDFFHECNVSAKLSCKASGIYSILLAQRRWLAALYSEKAPFVSSWGIAE